MSRTCHRRRCPRGERSTAILFRTVAARSSIPRLQLMTGGPHRGSDNLDMRAVTAEVITQSLQYLRFRRTLIGGEQRLGAHDHAVEAVAALRGLFLDERLLDGIGTFARAKTFQRHDVAAGAALD